MFNKKILTSLVVAGSLGLGSMLPAMAQPMPMGPPPPPHGMFGPEVGPLGYIFENLNLSAEQQAKVKIIVDNARLKEEKTRQANDSEMQSLANALLAPGKVTKDNLDPYIDKLGKIHKETLENHTKTLLALRNVLTPQQLVELKARAIKMREMRNQMIQLRGQMHQTARTGTAAPAVVPGNAQ